MSTKPDSRLYQLMAERVQDYGIFLLDTTGHIMSWNAGAAAIKQYSAQDVIGRHFSLFYTQADIDRNWPAQELQRATMEGRFEDEGWRVRKDGSRFWANVIITALRDDAGTLLAFSKITRDLTERKRQEESLRLSEERFRLLVDGVQDYAIYMLSPEGMVTSWNAGARRIKGYTPAEIIGKHFSRFYGPEEIEQGRPWAELAVAREHGRAEDEGWRVRKDGSRFWAKVVVTALYDSEKRLHGFAKVTQDLTQRRHSEALENSAGRVNDFLAVLAHELRNPLAPIRNAVQLQKMAKPDDPVQVKTRDIIDRQSSQLARIVDDLLDISRITRGTMSIEKKPMEIGALVRRAVETSRPALDAAGHTLEIDLPEEPLSIYGDELRLTQALANILNNAARYTDPGGRVFLRACRVEREGALQACISVLDTGRGIAPEFLPAVFGMFVQGKDLLNRPSAGLGVGLALARSIIELHHGTIEAKSEGVGKGAEFVLCMPLLSATANTSAISAAAAASGGIAAGGAGAVADTSAAFRAGGGMQMGAQAAAVTSLSASPPSASPPATSPPAAPAAQPAAAAAPAPGTLSMDAAAFAQGNAACRVLVVDDNVDAAVVLAGVLQKYGHEVLAVHDGFAALEVFAGFNPQIVLLDLGMPGMNGLEVARQLRARHQGARPLIVAVTGWNQQEDHARSLEAGFDLHLVKPVEEIELMQLLGNRARRLH